VNEKTARALVYARSAGLCERCGAARATNWHHRQARGRGKVGQWCPSNGMHLCGSGSTGCHGYITENPKTSREQGWSVPSWEDPANVPVWVTGREFVFLTPNGNYENPDGEAA
jgi:hypothetical protein